MLFVLTGSVQIGKTRWLIDLVDYLRSENHSVYGVVSPGTWIKPECDQEYKKTGIDAILLPEGERLPFAIESQASECHAIIEGAQQSSKAGLGWAISDDSLSYINKHFEFLCCQAFERPDASTVSQSSSGLLVIDELGKLELVHNGGLHEALSLLEHGPSVLYENAVVVVREDLLESFINRLHLSWEDISIVSPDSASGLRILDTMMG